MKITITIEEENAAFDNPSELLRILRTVPEKVVRIKGRLRRTPKCTCDAPEADDKLMDVNGNTVGLVKVER